MEQPSLLDHADRAYNLRGELSPRQHELLLQLNGRTLRALGILALVVTGLLIPSLGFLLTSGGIISIIACIIAVVAALGGWGLAFRAWRMQQTLANNPAVSLIEGNPTVEQNKAGFTTVTLGEKKVSFQGDPPMLIDPTRTYRLYSIDGTGIILGMEQIG